MGLFRLIQSIEPNFGRLIVLAVITLIFEKIFGFSSAAGAGILFGAGIATATKIRLKLFCLPADKICQLLAVVALWLVLLLSLAGGIFLSAGQNEFAYRLFSIACGWLLAFAVVIISTYEWPPRRRKKRSSGNVFSFLLRRLQTVPVGLK